jgi:hypothetical protein
MKAYIISEEDIQKLKDSMELKKLRELKNYDPQLRLQIEEFYRSMHYTLDTWIGEVTK